MIGSTRVLLGFVLAPPAPAVGHTVFLLTWGQESGHHLGYLIVVSFMISVVVGYPLAFFPGLALFLLFHAVRLTGLVPYVLTGAGLGLILFALVRRRLECQTIVAGATGAHCVAGSPIGPAFMVVCATTIAVAAFWLIVRPQRLPPH